MVLYLANQPAVNGSVHRKEAAENGSEYNKSASGKWFCIQQSNQEKMGTQHSNEQEMVLYTGNQLAGKRFCTQHTN